MISFVVVGKNEGWKVTNCLDSINTFINKNNIVNSEIIYVDSKSTDDSIKRAEAYGNVKVVLITGACNAAIGRNIGAQIANHEILFFLDGDMELLPEAYSAIFEESGQMIYPFIRGRHQHIHYNGQSQYLYTIHEPLNKTPIYTYVTGGLMVIQKELWNKVKGMDERLIRNQDIDLGLRLSKLNYPALLINQYFVKHHTVSYFEKKRLKYFFTSKALLSPGILLRKHIAYPKYLRIYYRNVFYVIFLLISFIILYLNVLWFIGMMSLYTMIQVLRVLKSTKNEPYILQSFLFKFLGNFYIIIGLFYFPKKQKTSFILI